MKMVSYLKEEHEHLGIVVDDLLYDVELIHPDIPNTMSMFLNYWDELFPILQAGDLAIREGTPVAPRPSLSIRSSCWLPSPFPLPVATAMRSGNT